MEPSSSRAYDLPCEAEVLAVLRAHGVCRAQLFGSAARGELTPSSNLNLLLSFNGPTNYGLLLRLTDTLEALTGREVDLIVDVDPIFAPYIEADLVDLPL